MAVVPDPRWRAVDATGAVYVGATMVVYNAGTTNPASIFSDAALSTAITLNGAHASDAQGYFPQWFAAEGALFDITMKDSGGVTIPDRTYVSVPSLGADTGSLTRDFTGSRLRIANASGTVRVEGGPAVGDDTGGLITLGGYDGTQSDLITLDGVNVDTTGPYLEQGKKILGVVATAKTAFTAVASVAIPLPNSPTGVLAWEVDIFGLFHTATSKLSITTSEDGGSTYASTGYLGVVSDTIPASVTPAASSTSKMEMSNQAAIISGTATHVARIRIIQSSVSAGAILLHSVLQGQNVGGTQFLSEASCTVSSGARLTHIKLTVAAGTITGGYRVVPLRGFGE